MFELLFSVFIFYVKGIPWVMGAQALLAMFNMHRIRMIYDEIKKNADLEEDNIRKMQGDEEADELKSVKNWMLASPERLVTFSIVITSVFWPITLARFVGHILR